MEAKRNNAIHLIAGGTAGTTGAVLTCPLEVVKTRLQSSVTSFVQVNVHAALRLIPNPQQVVSLGTTGYSDIIVNQNSVVDVANQGKRSQSQGLVVCLRHIIKTEGVRGLFKGLGPTIVGVAPSRAIYFGAYANSKQFLNTVFTPDSHFVHLCAAATAGISASTLTNPIWFVKTRLQLDQKTEDRLTCRECVRRIYSQHGLRGFYKGLTASYWGVSETVVHLVVYEAIKAKLQAANSAAKESADRDRTQLLSNTAKQDSEEAMVSTSAGGAFVTSDYLMFMVAGACSKTFATCLCYPHEVARTRMREEGSKYNQFFQTLKLVLKEEGRAGVYRGLGTQLIRQIPNTAIVMATYEFMVHKLSNYQW